MCVCVCVYDEFIEPWNCWELAILEKCYQNGQHKHTNTHMHINSHRCTEEKRARASGRELMKESQEEKKQKMLAGIHCCRGNLFLWPPPLQLLSLLCCCFCAAAVAVVVVVVVIDQHGGARGQVTDESKLWSITEHSLLQVSGVFSYV